MRSCAQKDPPDKLNPVEAQDHEPGAPVHIELADLQRGRVAGAHVADDWVDGCEACCPQRLLVLQRQFGPRKLQYT